MSGIEVTKVILRYAPFSFVWFFICNTYASNNCGLQLCDPSHKDLDREKWLPNKENTSDTYPKAS